MFAESYPRNASGLILFPRDVQRRAELFAEPQNDHEKHPAKANLWLVEECVKHFTEPGQLVMDVMAGTGTIMVAALIGRRVLCLDLNPVYINLMMRSAEKMGLGPDKAIIIQGDCLTVLPIRVDHIIFSPPYSGAMLGHQGSGKTQNSSIFFKDERVNKSYTTYASDLTMMNDFMYNQTMPKIYQKCFESLPSGGTLTNIIKDRMQMPIRIELGLAALHGMVKAGFKFKEWNKWKPPGTQFVAIHKKHGDDVVEDEHIITVVKP